MILPDDSDAFVREADKIIDVLWGTWIRISFEYLH